jgi:hypothetical protein
LRKLDSRVSATLVNFTDQELFIKNDGDYQLHSVLLQIGQSIEIDAVQIKVPPLSGAVVEFEIG